MSKMLIIVVLQKREMIVPKPRVRGGSSGSSYAQAQGYPRETGCHLFQPLLQSSNSPVKKPLSRLAQLEIVSELSEMTFKRQ